MDDAVRRVSELLHEAAETHHIVFRITDGADDDWASWYGDWLTRLSELPQILGGSVVRSHLVTDLVMLDREYVQRQPADRWEDHYAKALIERYGAA